MLTWVIDTNKDKKYYVILENERELFKISKSNTLENVVKQLKKKDVELIVR